MPVEPVDIDSVYNEVQRLGEAFRLELVSREDPILARAEQQKAQFEFYLVALTFTMLGFSIQTANFGVNSVRDCAELVSWFYLSLSGLLGLERLMKTPASLEVMFRTVHVYKLHKQRELLREVVDRWIENFHRASARFEAGVGFDSEEEWAQAKVSLDEGQAYLKTITERIEDLKNLFLENKSTLETQHKRFHGLHRRWSWQLALFGAGMILLLVARALLPISTILMLPRWLSIRFM